METALAKKTGDIFTNANDASGNGINGTITNDVVPTTDQLGNPNTTMERSIYVDGCLVATNTAAYGFTGDSFFEFGQENISMDDIRFYNRALSATEVQQLFVYESPPLIGLIKSVKPSFFNLSLGTNYQLQVSGDLNTWTNQGAAFTATNSSMVYPQYFDVNNWNQLFFRLQVNPQ